MTLVSSPSVSVSESKITTSLNESELSMCRQTVVIELTLANTSAGQPGP